MSSFFSFVFLFSLIEIPLIFIQECVFLWNFAFSSATNEDKSRCTVRLIKSDNDKIVYLRRTNTYVSKFNAKRKKKGMTKQKFISSIPVYARAMEMLLEMLVKFEYCFKYGFAFSKLNY